MSVNNLDLGAGGPVLLVDQPSGQYPHELISAGKSGTIYVINRDNMGHYNSNNDSQIIQSLPGVLPHGDFEIGNFSTPVYFNEYVYFAAVNDYLKAFQLTNGLLSHLRLPNPPRFTRFVEDLSQSLPMAPPTG